MTKNEFKKQLKNIIAYGGDVDKFVDDNIDSVDIKFDLNERFECVLTESGMEYLKEHSLAYSDDKVGKKTQRQIWSIIPGIHSMSTLPFINRKIVH